MDERSDMILTQIQDLCVFSCEAGHKTRVGRIAFIYYYLPTYLLRT
jgi:hypothetical protein